MALVLGKNGDVVELCPGDQLPRETFGSEDGQLDIKWLKG